jgi:hypothetical protein
MRRFIIIPSNLSKIRSLIALTAAIFMALIMMGGNLEFRIGGRVKAAARDRCRPGDRLWKHQFRGRAAIRRR